MNHRTALALLALATLAGCATAPRAPFYVERGDLVMVPDDRVNELVCREPRAAVRCNAGAQAPTGWPRQLSHCACL